MGFRTTIQNLVESAFVTLGDITETVKKQTQAQNTALKG